MTGPRLILYGEPVSLFTLRVTLGLKAKGIDLPLTDLPGGGPRSDAWHAINPIGKMPVLDVNGEILAESQVIAEYFEEVFPQRPLLPVDPLSRARCRLCCRIVDLYVMPPATAFYHNLDPQRRDAAATAAAGNELARALGYFAHYMRPGPYAVGSGLTLADLALAPLLDVLEHTILPIFDLPSPVRQIDTLAHWWRNIGDDPLVGPALVDYRERFRAFMQLD